MISEGVGYDEKGCLKHEGKPIDEGPEHPGEATVKGAGRPVPTLAESGSVEIHDRMPFEGFFGKYGKYGD